MLVWWLKNSTRPKIQKKSLGNGAYNGLKTQDFEEETHPNFYHV